MTPRVIIIGAGFGGLYTARGLANQNVDVLLIDRNNYHTFTPLLYQVATSGLDPSEIAYPIRTIFSKNKNKSKSKPQKTVRNFTIQRVFRRSKF